MANAVKLEQHDKLPRKYRRLPKEVKDLVAYWAHNTFFNETQTDHCDGYDIRVHPIIGGDSEEYAVVRVFDHKGPVFQGWIKLNALIV